MAETADSGKTKHRFENLGKHVDQQIGTAIPRVEEEVKKAIRYLNDEVIPRLRQNSSQALHAAAEHLRKVADHLDESGRNRSS